MTPEEALEQKWTDGRRSAWASMLRECRRQLGYQDDDLDRLIAEREEAIAVLRDACTDFGDNDWPDNLHLSDIIDKHLIRHLSK